LGAIAAPGGIMTRKERVKMSLEHKQPDICAYNIGFTREPGLKTAKFLGLAPGEELGEKIGNHLLYVFPALKWEEVKPGFYKDAFGAVWNRSVDKDIGNVAHIQLEEPSDLDSYSFPELDSKELYLDLEAYAKKNKDKFVVALLGFSLFERAWILRGMENLLCDLITDGGFVEELLDRILAWDLNYIDNCVKYPIDAMEFGDDWGQQQGLLMGPKHWRKFIKPRIAKMYKKVHDAGKKVFIHSCGDVEELFPDLIEAGVDVFNPFQPEVYDIYKVKREFGKKLTFFGGMSTQKVLPFGKPKEVKAETLKLIREIGKDGGYIFAPAHATPKDVPLENIAAMLEVLREQ